MTLVKAIEYLRKNKKATVRSNSCHAAKQNLSSLKYWIFLKDDDISYKIFLKAKDWKVENEKDTL